MEMASACMAFQFEVSNALKKKGIGCFFSKGNEKRCAMDDEMLESACCWSIPVFDLELNIRISFETLM